MKLKINILELFSGIGGFSLGLSQSGFTFKNHYFSEIDKHAIANYKYNFKNAKYVGSVTDVSGRELERPNIITFGSPCQDFSLAGKRKGMEGQRSSLILHAIRLISECRPDFFIWENVKGAFSSNDGADFWAIIQAFANIGGYRLEWQLCNTKWLLPQNRERIYLVGHLATSSRNFRGVFPFRENDSVFNRPYQPGKGWTQTQYSTTIKSGSTGGLKADDTFIEVPKVAGCLTGGGHSGGLHSDMTTIQVKSNTKKGFEEVNPGDSLNFSVPNSKTRRGRVGVGVAQTLDTACSQAVITDTQYSRDYRDYRDCAPTITSKSGELQVNRLRRLTEIERERLQGFPDNFTKFGIYEKQVWINKKEGIFKIIEGVKQIPRCQRYKLIGNAVTVNIVKIIGDRL